MCHVSILAARFCKREAEWMGASLGELSASSEFGDPRSGHIVYIMSIYMYIYLYIYIYYVFVVVVVATILVSMPWVDLISCLLFMILIYVYANPCCFLFFSSSVSWVPKSSLFYLNMASFPRAFQPLF